MATADDGAGAAQRMRERAARLRDMSPVFRAFGEEITKATADAFQASREVDGPDFPPLAESTIVHRASKLAGAKRRSKWSGNGITNIQDYTAAEKRHKRYSRLTKSAKKIRAAARALPAFHFTTLVDTGRLKNSQRCTLQGKHSLVWSAVGYGAPHITCGKRSGAALGFSKGYLAKDGGSTAHVEGGGFPPKRNFSCFEGTGPDARLKPRFHERLDQMIRQHVETGAVA